MVSIHIEDNMELLKKLIPILAPKIWAKLPSNVRLFLKGSLLVIPITVGGVNYEMILDATGPGCEAKFENVKGSDGQYFIWSDGDTLKTEITQ